MTLGFSTKWPARMSELAGKPNYFVEKILKSLPDKSNYFPAICWTCEWIGMSSLCNSSSIADTGDYYCSCPKCGYETIDQWEDLILGENGYYTHLDLTPKLHTILGDPHNRWDEGMVIEMVINNRTKSRFQFSPVIKCVSVQEIEIEYINGWLTIRVDGRYLLSVERIRLALNEGFHSLEHFKTYFNKDFKGKIIHWTDLKY